MTLDDLIALVVLIFALIGSAGIISYIMGDEE
jgi:hypothetical protein